MDAGTRHEISESETKGIMTHGSAGNLGVVFVPIALASQILQVTPKGPGGPCTLRGLCHSWGIPGLGNLNVVWGAANTSTLPVRGEGAL